MTGLRFYSLDVYNIQTVDTLWQFPVGFAPSWCFCGHGDHQRTNLQPPALTGRGFFYGETKVNDTPDPSALAAKATPPLAYGAATLAGLSIEQWISVLTVVYLVFAIITLIFPGWRVAVVSWWRKWRA